MTINFIQFKDHERGDVDKNLCSPNMNYKDQLLSIAEIKYI